MRFAFIGPGTMGRGMAFNLAAVQKSQQPEEKTQTVDDILASIFAKPVK